MKKFAALFLSMLFVLFAGCAPASQAPSASDAAPSSSQPKHLTVGIIQPVDHPSLNEIREAILNEFDAMGLSERLDIELRNANGDSSLLPTIMADLVGRKVDLLIPITTGAAQAAAAATDSIPIVFSAVSAPVRAGLVPSLDTVDRNVTGVSDVIPVEEILDLALRLTPGIQTFGFVYNTSEDNSLEGIERAREYCDAKGIAYREATITGVGELQQAAQSLIGQVDAFFSPIDNTVASGMPIFSQVANDARLPIYVSADSMVADGGLATVGINYTVLGQQTARMAARILDGAPLASNPVEAISEYVRMINPEVAELLSIPVTPDLTGVATGSKN